MKQFVLLLATSAALAFPGAVFAQHAHGPVHAPAFHRPVGPGHHPQIQGRHPPGFDRHHHRDRGYGNFGGWPVFMPPPGEPSREIVTHEFVDPRAFRPRAPRVDVLSDKPVVFREPPHIIQIGPHRNRLPIVVVRHGVISRE